MKDIYLPRNFTGNRDKDISNRIMFNFKWSEHGYAVPSHQDHDIFLRLTHVSTMNIEVPHFIMSFTSMTSQFMDDNIEPFLVSCENKKARFHEMMFDFGRNSCTRPLDDNVYKELTTYGKVRKLYNGWNEQFGFENCDSMALGAQQAKQQLVDDMFYTTDQLKDFVLTAHVTNNLAHASRREGEYKNRIYERCNHETSLIFKCSTAFTLERLPVQSFEI